MIRSESNLKSIEWLEAHIPIEDNEIRRRLTEANKGRDYSTYNWRMDAGLLYKAQKFFSQFPDIEEGDVIVDAGSGTGMLAELVASEYRGSRVIGLDLSHELQNAARKTLSMIELKYGDASEQNFPPQSVKVIYFSTSGHEVESFGGPGRMKQAVEKSFDCLVPNGKLLIRDFIKPDYSGDLLMEICAEENEYDQVAANLPTEQVDYNQMSSHGLLQRFHKEFAWPFDLTTVSLNGKTFYKLPAEFAYEFYMRKNYTGNWRNEIKEKYSYWTKAEAKQTLSDAGFTQIEVTEEKNPYMMEHWIEPEIRLYKLPEEVGSRNTDGSDIEKGSINPTPLELFPTHMVVSGVRPISEAQGHPKQIETIDYKRLAETILYEPGSQTLTIDEHRWKVSVPVVGTKKLVYRLEEPVQGKPAVLKTVRPNIISTHNAYVAMYQSIEREQVLRDNDISFLPILEKDESGPPYRYYIQEAIPDNAEFLSDLLLRGELPEDIITQMCRIINGTESQKQWQVDTNPFNWAIRQTERGNELVYVDTKVYKYNENWRFARVGLLQFLDPKYMASGKDCSPALPSLEDYQTLAKKWQEDLPQHQVWKKYLDPELQPR